VANADLAGDGGPVNFLLPKGQPGREVSAQSRASPVEGPTAEEERHRLA